MISPSDDTVRGCLEIKRICIHNNDVIKIKGNILETIWLNAVKSTGQNAMSFFDFEHFLRAQFIYSVAMILTHEIHAKRPDFCC